MSKLERLTHICLIAACVVSLGLLLERRFAPARSTHSPRLDGLIGKRLDLPGANWKSSKVNVVLFLNTHCHFCENSIPFYREVAGLRQVHPNDLSLSVLSVEPAEVMKLYLGNRQVPNDGVYGLPPALQRVASTPTLLLVGEDGTIRKIYSGELDEPRRREVLTILRKGSV